MTTKKHTCVLDKNAAKKFANALGSLIDVLGTLNPAHEFHKDLAKVISKVENAKYLEWLRANVKADPKTNVVSVSGWTRKPKRPRV